MWQTESDPRCRGRKVLTRTSGDLVLAFHVTMDQHCSSTEVWWATIKEDMFLPLCESCLLLGHTKRGWKSHVSTARAECVGPCWMLIE